MAGGLSCFRAYCGDGSGSLALVTPLFRRGLDLSGRSNFAELFRKGLLFSDAAPSESPEVIFSVRYGVTRATGSNPAVKKGMLPPTVASIHVFNKGRLGYSS